MHAHQSGPVLRLMLVLEITVLHPCNAALITSRVDYTPVLIWTSLLIWINMIGKLSGWMSSDWGIPYFAWTLEYHFHKTVEWSAFPGFYVAPVQMCTLWLAVFLDFLVFSDFLHILLVTFDWLCNFIQVLHSELRQFEMSLQGSCLSWISPKCVDIFLIVGKGRKHCHLWYLQALGTTLWGSYYCDLIILRVKQKYFFLW